MMAKIDKSERELFEKICAEHDFKCEFYTMENNPLLIQVVVTDNGKELTAFMGDWLGRMIQTSIELKDLKR